MTPTTEFLSAIRTIIREEIASLRQPAEQQPCRVCQKAYYRGRDIAYWNSLPKVDWDGRTPVALNEGYRVFLYSPEAVRKFLDANTLSPQDLRLVLCEPSRLPVFSMKEYLDSWFEDYLPRDFTAIDQAVNNYLAAGSPWSWTPTGKAINLASLAKLLESPA